MVIYRIVYFGVVFDLIFQISINSHTYAFSNSYRSLIEFMAVFFSMRFLKYVVGRVLFVVGNDKVGSLNTVNRGIGSDEVHHTVDTRNIVSRVKPELLSILSSVAAGAA